MPNPIDSAKVQRGQIGCRLATLAQRTATASASSVVFNGLSFIDGGEVGVCQSAGVVDRLAWTSKADCASRFAGLRASSALFRRRSLFASHAERDADVRRLLTRCALGSLTAFAIFAAGSLRAIRLRSRTSSFDHGRLTGAFLLRATSLAMSAPVWHVCDTTRVLHELQALATASLR
jgi:hypothetical protein